MTLAVLLFFGISFANQPWERGMSALDRQASSQPAPASSEASAPANPPKTEPASQEQQTAPSTSPAKESTSQAKSGAKAPARKKKTASTGCNSSGKASVPGSHQSKSASAKGSTGGKSDSPAPGNCPPPKIVVRQGGTAEPSIQLVGTPGGAPSVQDRDTSQMIESTESNLKKLDSIKLNLNEEEMVKQVRQFIVQSKAATAAGDVDQARTLAWKAQLLSGELLKPPK
jgi:hypothetical protein